MKVLLLAAGFGTRLREDILADTSNLYTDLLPLPKPLIPIAGKPLATRWIEQLLKTQSATLNDIYLVTNAHYYNQFIDWSLSVSLPSSHILNDGSLSNDTRLGAIACIQLAIEQFPINDDLCIIGGDTLFYPSFSLQHVFHTFKTNPYSLVLYYHDEDTLRTAILDINQHSLVTSFVEKPHPSTASSRKACPCFYLLKRHTLPLIRRYLQQTSEMTQRDAPGKLIEWLYKQTGILAYEIEGRYDIGGLQSYIECNEAFKHQQAASALQNDSSVSNPPKIPFINPNNQWAAGLALGAGVVASLLIAGKYRQHAKR